MSNTPDHLPQPDQPGPSMTRLYLLDDHTIVREGVRAVLVEKDHRPRWRYPRVEDVPAALVSEFFMRLGDDELDLPTRAEMQAARV